MDDDELQHFIDKQKPSSWGDVEERTLNGKTATWISPSKRPNVENSLIKMIDANRARDRRWNRDKKHKP